MMGIKEWNLDNGMHSYLWKPFKWLGAKFHFLHLKPARNLFLVIGVAAVYFAIAKPHFISSVNVWVAMALLALAFVIILFTFAYRGSALKAWFYLFLAHLFIMTGIGFFAPHINTAEIVFYATGVGASQLRWPLHPLIPPLL